MCCMYDVPIVLNHLDDTGVLKKNVKAFYVMYPDVFKDAYYDIEHVMRRIEKESAEKRVSSAMGSMFGPGM